MQNTSSIQKFESILDTLKSRGLSETFLFFSNNAREPRILNIRLKSIYAEAGLTEKDHKLNDLGKAFFDFIDGHVSGETTPQSVFPQVVSNFDM